MMMMMMMMMKVMKVMVPGCEDSLGMAMGLCSDQYSVSPFHIHRCLPRAMSGASYPGLLRQSRIEMSTHGR